MSILSGIHPVAEALRANHPLDRVLIAQGAGGPRLQEIIDMARRSSVAVRFEPRAALDRLAGTPAHQGVVAMGAAKKYSGLDDVASSDLIVVLDGARGVEVGSHEELIAKGGQYAELYGIQAAAYR